MTPRKLLILALAILLLLLATAARLHLLGAQSLWNDEGTSYVQATRTFSEIADNAARDIHPPGYYWLLAIWRVFTGNSEFALRLLSAFAGILTVALTYALGKRLYHPTAGLAAGVFVALNTFNLYYSQEARMYALLGLWAVASMWAFVGFIRTRQIRLWAVIFALCNAAGLYTHYAFPAVMVAQGVLLVVWLGAEFRVGTMPALSAAQQPDEANLVPTQSQRLVVFILANLLTIALYLPWLPTAWTQITTWPNTGQPIPFNDALTQIIGWFALGITYQISQNSIAVTFFLLFGLLCFPAQDGARTWWRMLVPVAWVAVTLGGFLALGLFREANLKFLIPAQIGFALWLGRGVWILWSLKPRRTHPFLQASPKLAALFGCLSLMAALWSGVSPLYHAPQYQRDDYRGIAAEVTPASAVILNAPGQVEVFRYYYGDGDHVYPLPIGLTVDTDATLTATRQIISDYRRIYAVLWGTSERDPLNLVENTLDAEAYEIDNRWFGNLRLVRYATPETMNAPVEVNAMFGDSIQLRSYALCANCLTPGGTITLELTWEAVAPIDRPYKIFVQLLNADGALIAQRDSEPVGGTLPTHAWTPNAPVIDHHALMIPNDFTLLNASLIVGFYNSDNPSERLPVDGGDYLVIPLE